jgi:hypothetical protein
MTWAHRNLRNSIASAVAVATVLALAGCIQQSAHQSAIEQVHQAIYGARETLGKFAAQQPTDEALTLQLTARAEITPSIQDYSHQDLEGLNLRNGQLLTYETDAQNHQEHVIAVGYGQALGAGGSASSDVHTCAILTARAGSTTVEVEQETCPDLIETIASQWGEAVSPT